MLAASASAWSWRCGSSLIAGLSVSTRSSTSLYLLARKSSTSARASGLASKHARNPAASAPSNEARRKNSARSNAAIAHSAPARATSAGASISANASPTPPRSRADAAPKHENIRAALAYCRHTSAARPEAHAREAATEASSAGVGLLLLLPGMRRVAARGRRSSRPRREVDDRRRRRRRRPGGVFRPGGVARDVPKFSLDADAHDVHAHLDDVPGRGAVVPGAGVALEGALEIAARAVEIAQIVVPDADGLLDAVRLVPVQLRVEDLLALRVANVHLLDPPVVERVRLRAARRSSPPPPRDRVSSPCFNRSCAERSASRPRASSSECSATNKRRETAARGAYALTIDSRSTGGGESSASIVKRCGRGGAREEARGRSKATMRLPALKTKHFQVLTRARTESGQARLRLGARRRRHSSRSRDA